MHEVEVRAKGSLLHPGSVSVGGQHPWVAAQCQLGRRGIPQLPAFISFNKLSFCVFIFCTYLVNISGMLFERDVGQYPPENRCCGEGRDQGSPMCLWVVGARRSLEPVANTHRGQLR